MNIITHTVDTETGCGRELANWPVTFSVAWSYDFDSGYEADCTAKRAVLGNLNLTRNDLILLCGEAAVDRFERETAEAVAPNWRDYLPEAAE